MIDLHIHSTHSDGSNTTEELLTMANNLNLEVISITDHNSIGAHLDIAHNNLRHLFGGKIITGIEITTNYKGETIEILGYNFDINKMHSRLPQFIDPMEIKQKKEFAMIISQYNKIGVKLNEEDIPFVPLKSSPRRIILAEIIKHPENDRFFLDSDSKFTFAKFLRHELYNPDSPLFVDYSPLFPSLTDTLNIIHSCGGLAFLAHPYTYSHNIITNLENILDNHNIDGIECYYPTFTPQQTEFLTKICKSRNIHISGGSDYHGILKPHIELGTGINNNLNIPHSVCTPWTTK